MKNLFLIIALGTQIMFGQTLNPSTFNVSNLEVITDGALVNLEAGKKFSNLIKNSTTHVIKGCGHMIMIEKAFEMREKILEFLN